MTLCESPAWDWGSRGRRFKSCQPDWEVDAPPTTVHACSDMWIYSTHNRFYTSRVAVYKVLLFYAFTPLADPDAIRLWQRDLCESLGLGGRILLSPHGINATVGGELSAVKKYRRKLGNIQRSKTLISNGARAPARTIFPNSPSGFEMNWSVLEHLTP